MRSNTNSVIRMRDEFTVPTRCPHAIEQRVEVYLVSMSRSIVHEISTAVQQGVYQYVLPDRYLGVRAGKIRSPRIGNRFLPLTQAALGGNDVLAS